MSRGSSAKPGSMTGCVRPTAISGVRTGKGMGDAGVQPGLDYLARYLTLLSVLETCRFPEIRFAPPQAERGLSVSISCESATRARRRF